MNSRWRKTVCLILGALLLSVTGCGGQGKPKVAKVKGVVKYRGQPLANAGVAFHPANGRTATGQTNDSGEFTLSTFGTADGAIIGEHTVTVTKQDPSTIPPAPSPNSDPGREPPKTATGRPKYLVPVKYIDPKTSDLKATVENKGMNEINLEVKD